MTDPVAAYLAELEEFYKRLRKESEMDHIRVHEQREENPKPDPKVYLRAAWVAFVCLGLVGALAWFLFVPPAIPPADKRPSSINGTFVVTIDGQKHTVHIQKASD